MWVARVPLTTFFLLYSRLAEDNKSSTACRKYDVRHTTHFLHTHMVLNYDFNTTGKWQCHALNLQQHKSLAMYGCSFGTKANCLLKFQVVLVLDNFNDYDIKQTFIDKHNSFNSIDQFFILLNFLAL